MGFTSTSDCNSIPLYVLLALLSPSFWFTAVLATCIGFRRKCAVANSGQRWTTLAPPAVTSTHMHSLCFVGALEWLLFTKPILKHSPQKVCFFPMLTFSLAVNWSRRGKGQKWLQCHSIGQDWTILTRFPLHYWLFTVHSFIVTVQSYISNKNFAGDAGFASSVGGVRRWKVTITHHIYIFLPPPFQICWPETLKISNTTSSQDVEVCFQWK